MNIQGVDRVFSHLTLGFLGLVCNLGLNMGLPLSKPKITYHIGKPPLNGLHFDTKSKYEEVMLQDTNEPQKMVHPTLM